MGAGSLSPRRTGLSPSQVCEETQGIVNRLRVGVVFCNVGVEKNDVRCSEARGIFASYTVAEVVFPQHPVILLFFVCISHFHNPVFREKSRDGR